MSVLASKAKVLGIVAAFFYRLDVLPVTHLTAS